MRSVAILSPLHGAYQAKKIGTTSKHLAAWEKVTYGGIKSKIKRLGRKLGRLQKKPPSGDMLAWCKAIVERLDLLHKEDESYWYLRAQANDFCDGDKNSSYFHHKANSKRMRNYIKGLEDDEGVWHKEKPTIQLIMIAFYASLFATRNSASPYAALIGIERVTSEDMNIKLLRPLTKDELWIALDQMHPTKAPGLIVFTPYSFSAIGTLLVMMFMLWRGTSGKAEQICGR